MQDIATLVILIVLSAFFSSAETALISLSSHKIRALLKQKKFGALSLYRIRKHPRRLVITILIGNNVVNVWASALASLMAISHFGSKGLGIATGVMTFILLLFGEITPKSIAITYAATYGRYISRIIELLTWVLYPFVRAFEWFTNIIAKTQKQPMTEEEFLSVIEAGEKDKVIEKIEKEFIEGVLEFNDIRVRQVMTPRAKMFSLDGDLNLSKCIKQIQRRRYSRTPVIERSTDNIIGVVLLKDAFSAYVNGKDPKLRDIAIKPLFVSGERIISDLFHEMQKKHRHLAVVIDEFGGTAGIVTLEDLMEEILGEIRDEGEKPPQKIWRESKKSIVVMGGVEIEEVNEFFKTKIPPGRYMTINGFLVQEFKRVPRKGRKLKIADLMFTILEATSKQILKVRIEKP
ncbi:MAG: hemolysin family protein [Nanoarchaeota archaeon]|nr:hemolysin family protein [Nanoarchaeota archaeon]